MQDYLQSIHSSELFLGFGDEDITMLLDKLPCQRKKYEKGNFIFFAGDKVPYVSIVLAGAVHIIQEDYWGNRNILAPVSPGGMFGEAFACLAQAVATVSVVATDATEILCIDISQFLSEAHVLTAVHRKFMMNLLAIMARRNMQLTGKFRYITQRSTRKKIMFYLSDEAIRQHANQFTLPFNRQQLADFLSVDRSALSAELSKMKKDGLIDYYKDQFVLIQGQTRKGL